MRPHTPAPKRSRASKRGFTLVEIGLVVLIIGMLTMLAIPLITKGRDNARAARFINDLRNGVQSFELYALMTGYYPDAADPGVIPVGMEEELRRPQWDKPTPIGGTWDWVLDEGAVYAGVAVVAPTSSLALLQAIDQRMDDGNLGTGRFFGDASGVTFLIE